MENEVNKCPACGYLLGFPPWIGDSPSDEICPCCGIHFGYDDFVEGIDPSRESIYDRWRDDWVRRGMIWWSQATLPPQGWNPEAQLTRVRRSA